MQMRSAIHSDFTVNPAIPKKSTRFCVRAVAIGKAEYILKDCGLVHSVQASSVLFPGCVIFRTDALRVQDPLTGG